MKHDGRESVRETVGTVWGRMSSIRGRATGGKGPRRGSASRAGEHAAIERLADLAPPYRPVHAHGVCSMCEGLGRFGHDTRSTHKWLKTIGRGRCMKVA